MSAQGITLNTMDEAPPKPKKQYRRIAVIPQLDEELAEKHPDLFPEYFEEVDPKHQPPT